MTAPIPAIIATTTAATAAAVNASNAARLASKTASSSQEHDSTNDDGVPIRRYTARSRRYRLWLFIKRPFTAPVLYVKNTKFLDECGWYRTISGGYRDSHGCEFYSLKELCSMKIYGK